MGTANLAKKLSAHYSGYSDTDYPKTPMNLDANEIFDSV
jgi:hypothetical protein